MNNPGTKAEEIYQRLETYARELTNNPKQKYAQLTKIT